MHIALSGAEELQARPRRRKMSLCDMSVYLDGNEAGEVREFRERQAKELNARLAPGCYDVRAPHWPGALGTTDEQQQEPQQQAAAIPATLTIGRLREVIEKLHTTETVARAQAHSTNDPFRSLLELTSDFISGRGLREEIPLSARSEPVHPADHSERLLPPPPFVERLHNQHTRAYELKLSAPDDAPMRGALKLGNGAVPGQAPAFFPSKPQHGNGGGAVFDSLKAAHKESKHDLLCEATCEARARRGIEGRGGQYKGGEGDRQRANSGARSQEADPKLNEIDEEIDKLIEELGQLTSKDVTMRLHDGRGAQRKIEHRRRTRSIELRETEHWGGGNMGRGVGKVGAPVLFAAPVVSRPPRRATWETELWWS